MKTKSLHLDELIEFCNKQFDTATEGNTDLLTPQQIQDYSSLKSKAEEAARDYDELAKAYAQLQKDYKDSIMQNGTSKPDKECNDPAAVTKKLTIEEFSKSYFNRKDN